MDSETMFVVLVLLLVIGFIGCIVAFCHDSCKHKWKIQGRTSVKYRTATFGIANNYSIEGELTIEQCELCKQKHAYVTNGCDNWNINYNYAVRNFFQNNLTLPTK
jgi:hypothetical protein